MNFRINRTVKLTLLATAVGLFALSLNFAQKSAHAYRGGPDPSKTGAPAIGAIPAELTCNSTGCHTGNAVNNGQGSVQILDLPTGYTPGATYTLRVTVTRTTNSVYGFQLVVLDANGANSGTLATADARTQTIAADPGSWAGRNYIEQSNSSVGNTPSASNTWTFRWTAPNTCSGRITFYAAGNAANNDRGSSGDFIYTTSASIDPQVTTVNGATFSSTAPITLTAGGIGSGFGCNMATTTASATDADPNTPGFQLPTTLGGTTVAVRDSTNTTRNAGLFYVSPTQVNYLIPAGTANGTATITITASNNAVSTGSYTIASVQPGIFTTNQVGTGYAAAQIQRIRNGTTLAFEDVSTGPVANPVAVPIEWKDPNDVLYLVLYATGVRNVGALANVTATIGGAAQSVNFAGVQPDFAGLDQVNILLNRNLVPPNGDKDVVVTVDGKAANTVRINFK